MVRQFQNMLKSLNAGFCTLYGLPKSYKVKIKPKFNVGVADSDAHQMIL